MCKAKDVHEELKKYHLKGWPEYDELVNKEGGGSVFDGKLIGQMLEVADGYEWNDDDKDKCVTLYGEAFGEEQTPTAMCQEGGKVKIIWPLGCGSDVDEKKNMPKLKVRTTLN
jgi:hypothetical protein